MPAKIIAKRSNLHIAPEGITFEVQLSGFDTGSGGGGYDPRLHDLYYEWNFGDPGEYTIPVNTVPEHKNANLGYGPLVSHVFKSAGTYTVTLRVTERSSGKTATASYKVITGDADAVFSGANTLFVDSQGNYSGAPSGAVGYASLNAALAGAAKSGQPKRIMLRRGQSFPTQSMRLRRNLGSLCICASPGSGAKPELVWQKGKNKKFFWVADMDAGKTKDVILDNIRFQGPWDSTTETGAAQVSALVSGKNRASYILVNRCEFDGFSMGIVTIESTEINDVMIVNDTYITNWQDYGMFEQQQGYTSVLGCRITQNINAMSGGPKDWSHNRHGCLRSHIGRKFVMDGCDLFSRNGWFKNIDGWHTNQPCLRWNQGGNKGAVANVQRTSAEGGYEVFAVTKKNGSVASALQNAIIDKCILVGNFMSASLIRIEYAGTTIRNCIFVHPDVPRDISGIYNPAIFINLDGPGPNPANAAGPIRIYNNSFINLMTDAHGFKDKGGAATLLRNKKNRFTNVIAENNMIHQPNLGRPQLDDAPLDMTPLFLPRFKGYISFLQKPLKSQYATPANTVVAAIPLEGSDALGDAISGLTSLDDFLGRPRPAYPSRGAREIPS